MLDERGTSIPSGVGFFFFFCLNKKKDFTNKVLCAFSLCIRMEDSHCVLPLSSRFGVRSRRVEALQSVGI